MRRQLTSKINLGILFVFTKDKCNTEKFVIKTKATMNSAKKNKESLNSNAVFCTNYSFLFSSVITAV